VGIELPAPLAAYRERIALRPAYSAAMGANFAALAAVSGEVR
jgi:hypothetical protein